MDDFFECKGASAKGERLYKFHLAGWNIYFRED